MIEVSEHISLQPISIADQIELYDLMKKIYPPVYAHLWNDDGSWFLRETYSYENLKNELEEQEAHYYFILYKYELVGILRLISNEHCTMIEKGRGVKLQRLYIDPSVHHIGIGKSIINWVERSFFHGKNSNSVLWLEVMDSQDSAIGFYRKMGYRIIDSCRFGSDRMKEEFRGMYIMSKSLAEN